MGSTVARVALHRSAHSRGYKLSREGTDPRSLRKMVCVCVLNEVCAMHPCVFLSCLRPLEVWPLPPLL
jgi:hypothetical protein